jgi:hypothetical protein
LTCEVKNLTNSTGYTFAIVARNIVGPGAAAVTSKVTPVAAVTPAPPSEPRDLAGEGADRSIVVSWKKPTSSGTQPITEYKVVAKPGGASCTVVPNSSDRTFTCTITGLDNGSDYTLTATAKNSVGLSPKATAGPATPATVPSKVRDLVIDGVTSKGVSLSWKAPLDNGGAKVTGYRVRYQPENATSDIFTFYADVTTTSVVVKGLTKGRWFFSVRAINVAGTGAFVVTTKAAKVL